MATVNEIRESLIDKIMNIKNKEFLLAINNIISSSLVDCEITELTAEQAEMLEISESDIANGRLISQEAMDKRNLEWLNEL